VLLSNLNNPACQDISRRQFYGDSDVKKDANAAVGN
jgi:hypothetical protein